MLYRQCDNTFIRRYPGIGYVMNQLTRLDRVYDEIGSIFLGAIGRQPQTVEAITKRLLCEFIDISPEDLQVDVQAFVDSLVLDGFVVAGATPAECDSQSPRFSYAVERPKTVAIEFLHRDATPISVETAEFLYEHFRHHPMIFGMHMEISSRCNQRCVHCYQVRDAGANMSRSLALDLLAQLAALGTVSLTLSGGEPTLHPDLEELLWEARRLDFLINVLTNGTSMPRRLVNTLRAVNVNTVQVSLYAIDAKIHDSITGVPGSHAHTVQAIEDLITAEIPVQVSCPVMKQNLNGYRALARWCAERKVRLLSDFILMARSDFDQLNLGGRLDLDQTRQLIHDIVDSQGDYQEQLRLPPLSRDPERWARQPVCGVGIDNACITADGRVYPCSGFQGMIVGDVHKESLKHIWARSPELQALRSITNASFSKCLECGVRDYCAMCLVRNYNESGGNMFALSPHYCAVAHINQEIVEQKVPGIRPPVPPTEP